MKSFFLVPILFFAMIANGQTDQAQQQVVDRNVAAEKNAGTKQTLPPATTTATEQATAEATKESAISKDALAKKLLQQSDQARGGLINGVTWEIKIETSEDDEKSERLFLVKAKGDNANAEAIAPSRNKGEIYLFLNRNMWFYKPSVKKPVSISSRQKLSGQAANGDIASTNYARDYNATIEREEVLDGEKTTVLFLKGKTADVTYDKIRYWVATEAGLARKAEFLSLQAQPLKIAKFEYNSKITLNGKTLPFISRMTITDAKFPKNQSVINYGKIKAESHPDSLFNVNNLTR